MELNVFITSRPLDQASRMAASCGSGFTAGSTKGVGQGGRENVCVCVCVCVCASKGGRRGRKVAAVGGMVRCKVNK
jgi:hypothetical protein